MKNFGGPILFLDRGDINTDEIIPARYLTENSILALKPYLLEDLKLAGFDPKHDIEGKRVVLSRANFGCGSSREHAAWALETNDIRLVVAESFARIFRQNMYNRGLLALELPAAVIAEAFTRFASQPAELTINLELKRLTITAAAVPALEAAFKLGDFELALIKAGGWVELAAARY